MLPRLRMENSGWTNTFLPLCAVSLGLAWCTFLFRHLETAWSEACLDLGALLLNTAILADASSSSV